MLLGEGIDNGIHWSLLGRGDYIFIFVNNGKGKYLESKYECSYRSIFGYDVYDVNEVNKKLDELINECK